MIYIDIDLDDQAGRRIVLMKSKEDLAALSSLVSEVTAVLL